MITIAFEGIDKAGKFSQTNLLVARLRDNGCWVEKSEFHFYESPTGRLIQKWLRGEYDVSQHTIELIMAADKQALQEEFNQLEKQGVEFLILDRYIGSQIVYSTSAGIDIQWAFALQKYMRKPDMEILIDIPPEVSMARKGKYGDNDRYESDLQLLTKVRRNYSNYFDFFASNRLVVNGELPVEEIHNLIWEHISKAYLK